MERKNFTNFDQIKVRLLQYIEMQNIAKTDFFEKSTIAASNFAGKGAESALSTTKIVQILTCYPDLNPDWLLLGKGNMIRNFDSDLTSCVPSDSSDNMKSIIEILNHTIIEKDKQIDRLLSIIESNKL